MQYGYIKGITAPVSRILYGLANPVMRAAERQGTKEAIEAAFAILDGAFSLGINAFDCAATYGEQILGKWLESRGSREKCVILSKCAHPSKERHRLCSADIFSDAENSLAKLKTNCIDIYLLHRDVDGVPVGELVEALNRLYDQGKVKVFGGSNWTVQRIEQANEYAAKHNLVPFTASSPRFSLAEHIPGPYSADPFTNGCIGIAGKTHKEDREFYQKTGMPVFAYSSLAYGFFSGRAALEGYDCENNYERLRRCRALAEKKQVSASTVALSFVLNYPMNVYAVVGTSSLSHLKENIECIPLTGAQIAWLDLETDTLK